MSHETCSLATLNELQPRTDPVYGDVNADGAQLQLGAVLVRHYIFDSPNRLASGQPRLANYVIDTHVIALRVPRDVASM